MSRNGLVLPLVAALALGACESNAHLGGDSAAEEAAAAVGVQVPVEAVQSVEIGRTRDGFLVTAYGSAAGLGYARPTLRPRRGGAPGVDGYLEYDFVATEPAAGLDLPPGSAQARRLRADLPVQAASLRGARGIRVLGLTGGAQLDFAPAPPPPTTAGQLPG